MSRRGQRGVRMYPATTPTKRVRKEVKAVTEESTTQKRRSKRYPTKHYVREALAAHIGQNVTSAMIVAWVRKSTGQTVRLGGVSTNLADLVKSGGDFEVDASGPLSLSRLSQGLYRVERPVATVAEQAVPEATNQNGAAKLVPGDLLEVVHVTRDDLVVAMDGEGNFYRLSR